MSNDSDDISVTIKRLKAGKCNALCIHYTVCLQVCM